MDFLHRIGKLVLAGAVVVGLSSAALAQWVVVKIGDECNVIEESVAGDEIRVAGPFATEEEAEEAKRNEAQCIVRHDNR